MDLARFWWSQAAVPGPANIGNSLRFRNGQSLNRNAVAPTEARIWTLSFWIKLTNLQAQTESIFSSGDAQTNFSDIRYHSTKRIDLSYNIGPGERQKIDPGERRDPFAWYHVHCTCDTTGNNSNNMVFFTINGVRDVPNDGISNMVQNEVMPWQVAGTDVRIGDRTYWTGASDQRLDGYLAEFRFIDGQVVPAANFGRFDDNDVWIPIEYNGAFGNNGFYLDFSDLADVGADRSGNGNDFTPNNFQLADQTSVLFDHFTDSPVLNAPNFMQLVPGVIGSVIRGGMHWDVNTDRRALPASISVLRGNGRFYWELLIGGTGECAFGAIDWPEYTRLDPDLSSGIGSFSSGYSYTSNRGANGRYFNQNDLGAADQNYTAGDVVGFYYDSDTGQIFIAVNGVFNEGGGEPFTGGGEYPVQGLLTLGAGTVEPNPAQKSSTLMNMGQQADWWRDPNTDWTAGGGQWQPLNTDTMGDAPIPNGRDHFRAITDTGANILATAGAAFAGSLIWIKDRVNANEHQILSPLQGVNECWTNPNDPVNPAAYAAPAGNSVAWVWNCSDNFVPVGSAGTGYAGRRNVAAGFGMASFNGPINTGFTFTHGLSAAPDFMIHKGITVNGAPWVYHRSMGNDRAMRLDNNTPAGNWTGVTFWNNTDPDATNISIGSGLSNGNGGYQVYYWHAVPGYSAFGSYEGNGDDDGPFIYTGFRPAFLMIKVTTRTGSWFITDSTRTPLNPASDYLFTNLTNAEDPSASTNDLLSNGFKVRNTGASLNSAGNTFVYAAFAENPLGGGNVSPVTAR